MDIDDASATTLVFVRQTALVLVVLDLAVFGFLGTLISFGG